MIGVVNVHAAMIGENMKLTLDVPYFCSRNRPIRIPADRASTVAAKTKRHRPWPYMIDQLN